MFEGHRNSQRCVRVVAETAPQIEARNQEAEEQPIEGIEAGCQFEVQFDGLRGSFDACKSACLVRAIFPLD